MQERTLITLTAIVDQVLMTSQTRERKVWDDHKRELVPVGITDAGWAVKVKEPSLASVFPLADMRVTLWFKKGETPDLHPGKRYTMEVAIKGPYRTLMTWRELHEEDEPDVIDEALASVGIVAGGRGAKPCPPPPAPVVASQASMDRLRRDLEIRKANKKGWAR